MLSRSVRYRLCGGERSHFAELTPERIHPGAARSATIRQTGNTVFGLEADFDYMGLRASQGGTFPFPSTLPGGPAGAANDILLSIDFGLNGLAVYGAPADWLGSKQCPVLRDRRVSRSPEPVNSIRPSCFCRPSSTPQPRRPPEQVGRWGVV